jgi:hypothetical protein
MARYKRPAPKRLASAEHNETVYQSDAISKGDLKSHPAIAEGLHTFATNPKAFSSAMQSSKIEPLTKSMNIQNTDFGQGTKGIDPSKQERVSGMLGGRVDRPIVMRYTDRMGQQFNHMLAGNTRATNIGEGVEAHVIEL